MKKNETEIAGKILQARDKVMARRHCIPAELKKTWANMLKEIDKLAPQINPRMRQKHIAYKGDASSMIKLLSSINQLDNSLQR